MDRYPAHRHRQVLDAVQEGNGVHSFIPGRCTSILQPLDLTVNRSFKCHLRTIWKAWKVGHTDEHGHCEQISRAEVVRMVSLAWERVNERTILNGWRASGLLRDRHEDGHGGGAVIGLRDEMEEVVDGIDFEELNEEEEFDDVEDVLD